MRHRAMGWLAGAAAACVVAAAGCARPGRRTFATPPAARDGAVVMRVAMAQNADAFAAGKAAAEALQQQMGEVAPHVVLVSECFDERRLKRRALKGICSVFPRAIVFGGATYGSFAQAGCADSNAVGLLAIGGPGVSVAAALHTGLGTARLSFETDEATIVTRLHDAGQRLARKLPRTPDDKLLLLIADAHSPKNAPLVEGVQREVGGQFPIVGGCVNKNAGQTYVYYQGRMYRDSAVAIVLAGDFRVALSGRMAKENAKVIASAKVAAAEALKRLEAKPFAALAFNCAGRKGKLQRIEDELAAIQQALGKSLPLFGCYCAGEIGPADRADKKPGVLSSGEGWHVMFALLGR